MLKKQERIERFKGQMITNKKLLSRKASRTIKFLPERLFIFNWMMCDIYKQQNKQNFPPPGKRKRRKNITPQNSSPITTFLLKLNPISINPPPCKGRSQKANLSI